MKTIEMSFLPDVKLPCDVRRTAASDYLSHSAPQLRRLILLEADASSPAGEWAVLNPLPVSEGYPPPKEPQGRAGATVRLLAAVGYGPDS